jgi:hypothetical protein
MGVKYADQMAICKICRPKGHKIYQLFSFQDPPKFTQIGIFGNQRPDVKAISELARAYNIKYKFGTCKCLQNLMQLAEHIHMFFEIDLSFTG